MNIYVLVLSLYVKMTLYSKKPRKTQVYSNYQGSIEQLHNKELTIAAG